MNEIRFNPVLKRWVIIAPSRSKRPIVSRGRLFCPFCSMRKTPHTIKKYPANLKWEFRVIPNKFSALSPGKKILKRKNWLHQTLNSIGRHEVVILRDHYKQLQDYSYKDLALLFSVFRDRYNDLKKKKFVENIEIIQNKGKKAGASIAHPHFQIFSTPVIPDILRLELENCKDYYDKNKRCLFCDLTLAEEKDKKRIIEKNKDFISFIPYCARNPFVIRIIPLSHTPRFENETDKNIQLFSRIFRKTMVKLHNILPKTDYNLYIHTSPAKIDAPYFHWHLQIRPRTANEAGFELATNMYINTHLPEEDAMLLNRGKQQ